MPELYRDLSPRDYQRAFVQGYSGGATWLRLDGYSLVVPCLTPVEITAILSSFSDATIRARVYTKPEDV